MSRTDNHINNTLPSSAKVDEEEQKIWSILQQVNDPEIPVVSVVDLGIVRGVGVAQNTSSLGIGVTITITPTYSGCPAMDMIALNIRIALLENGYTDVNIKTILSPVWTTDWMTEAGKQKLKAYGIAPPVGKRLDNETLEDLHPECPQCHSTNTRLINQFGSTSCKALFQCNDCKEPFDYFKCH